MNWAFTLLLSWTGVGWLFALIEAFNALQSGDRVLEGKKLN
jgi:hypothetical protein